ncbi:hypothetical protein Noda2021_01820 [Candidatus Dependentiae bacterium Noda2021]|nr:hypothetical protein Noda2021_01820 [Candidatus Dependentiae bacterium Noda2021]
MNKLILSFLLLTVGGTTLGMYQKDEVQALELKQEAALSDEHTKQIKHIHFFNDGTMLSIAPDKAVYWSKTFQKVKEVVWENGAPLVVASSADYIAIAHDYKNVTIYTLDLSHNAEFKFESMLIDSLCFVNDNQLIAAMTNGSLMLLDVSTNTRQPYILRKDNNNAKVTSMNYNQAKEILNISWDDGCIGQWDVSMREGLPALTLETHARVKDFAYTDGKMITLSDDEYMRVWNKCDALGSHSVQATFNAGKGCSVLTVSADGVYAAVSHLNGISIFDVHNKELIEKVSLPSRAHKITFAPDNSLIIGLKNRLFRHVISYQPVNMVHDVNPVNEQNDAALDTPEQRYFQAWQQFAQVKQNANIQERISNLKGLLTKSFKLDDATEKAFKRLIQQSIATSYFDHARAQTSTRDRYQELVALKNSNYLQSYDYAEKAAFERNIQNEINKIGLVRSLWFTWSGRATNWVTSKVNTTLMKLTPILT